MERTQIEKKEKICCESYIDDMILINDIFYIYSEIISTEIEIFLKYTIVKLSNLTVSFSRQILISKIQIKVMHVVYLP